MNYRERYDYFRLAVEETLRGAVPADVPQPLGDAMRYSLLSGGKRLRAVLLLASYAMLEREITPAFPFAAALEMVHAYSLIHDDLPAMDNDDLRRGKPTCHKVFGEGMAVLAGDGLLSLAFETMAASAHPRAFAALGELAARCGTRGMVAGQCVDLDATGGGGDEERLRYIHLHKTADLIIAPVTMGLLLAGADEALLEAGRAYAQNLGIAFQIVDDLLDVTGDEAALGKHTGKDAAENKCTWVTVYGVEKARADARRYTEEAVRHLTPWPQGEFLQLLARQILTRAQ